MNADIFMCSYLPDLEWVKYSLRSIDKYVSGFRRVVLVVPHSDLPAFAEACSSVRTPVRLVGLEPGKDGHMDQNIAKTSPDLYSDAYYFLHVDSDRIFFRECSPREFLVNGYPEIWYERYDRMVGEWEDHPGGVPWREITSNALGFPVEVETMRRLPVMLPRWLHRDTRERIEQVHEMPFAEYVRSAPRLGNAFHGYSEFNALGCLAYYRSPLNFVFTSWRDKAASTPLFAHNMWSHHLRSDPEKFENELRPMMEKICSPDEH